MKVKGSLAVGWPNADDKIFTRDIHLLETNSKFAPENRLFVPKGKDRLLIIHFQVRTVSFREGKSDGWSIDKIQKHSRTFVYHT